MKKICCLTMLVLLLCSGCSAQNERAEKLRDLEFSIVKDEEIPGELMQKIEEKKQDIFKLTYEDGGQLYIAVGYGEQKSGGYSIQVKECYLSQNALYFDTELIGPKKEEITKEGEACPYIVVCTEQREESVVFQ